MLAKQLLLATVCDSGSDGGERAGREVVDASSGCVYIRQVGRTCTYHHHWLCPALSRYVYTHSLLCLSVYLLSPSSLHCGSKNPDPYNIFITSTISWHYQ